MTNKNLPVEYDEIYDNLREQVASIRTEIRYNVREEMLKGKWLIGEAVVENGPPPKYGNATIKRLADDFQISERELYYCRDFYKSVPNFLPTPEASEQPDMDSLADELGVQSKDEVHWTRVKREKLDGKNPCEHNETKVKVSRKEFCTNCGKIISSQTIEEKSDSEC